MPAYRIYWFDQDDHVTEADYLIADADDDVRGGASCVVALEATTGKMQWKSYTIVQEAKPTVKNSFGLQMMGPSGAAVWSTPTFDTASAAIPRPEWVAQSPGCGRACGIGRRVTRSTNRGYTGPSLIRKSHAMNSAATANTTSPGSRSHCHTSVVS